MDYSLIHGNNIKSFQETSNHPLNSPDGPFCNIIRDCDGKSSFIRSS